MSETVEDKITE